jgi:hypothetical protein
VGIFNGDPQRHLDAATYTAAGLLEHSSAVTASSTHPAVASHGTLVVLWGQLSPDTPPAFPAWLLLRLKVTAAAGLDLLAFGVSWTRSG